jgi:hypothetical protein
LELDLWEAAHKHPLVPHQFQGDGEQQKHNIEEEVGDIGYLFGLVGEFHNCEADFAEEEEGKLRDGGLGQEDLCSSKPCAEVERH